MKIVLVVETTQFERALNALSDKIQYANEIVTKAKPSLNGKLRSRLIGVKTQIHWFELLKTELQSLTLRTTALKAQLNKYRQLGGRYRRSLLPFVGSTLRFLFGTLDESDVRTITSQIGKLALNQKRIVHVVEQSLTLLNASRLEISDNRDRINAAILSIGSIDARVRKISTLINKEFLSLVSFLEAYLRLDLTINEISQQITVVSEQIQNFGITLDHLAIGRLTPSIVTPENLRQILLQVKSKLEPTQDLPEDPIRNIWNYFKLLSTNTILELKL